MCKIVYHPWIPERCWKIAIDRSIHCNCSWEEARTTDLWVYHVFQVFFLSSSALPELLHQDHHLVYWVRPKSRNHPFVRRHFHSRTRLFFFPCALLSVLTLSCNFLTISFACIWPKDFVSWLPPEQMVPSPAYPRHPSHPASFSIFDLMESSRFLVMACSKLRVTNRLKGNIAFDVDGAMARVLYMRDTSFLKRGP